MAAENSLNAQSLSPKPVVYHSPATLTPNRSRAGSGRKSFNSGAALPPSMIESPRTVCVHDSDSDVFSFNPSHMARWYVRQDLWERLPASLQTALTNMQRAGAAALSGFERVEQHSGAIDIGPRSEAPEDEMLVQLDESLGSLPPALRTESSACSSSAILSSPSSRAQSPSSTSASIHMSPISPICLTPTDSAFPLFHRKESRERSFSTPLEPHNAKYATELSQLRTESLPRLRHTARKVDTEWTDVRHTGLLSSADANDFENWWANKKCTIENLNECIKRLSDSIGLTSNGMGWTAP